MVRKNKLRDTGCPIAFSLDTFGDRWSLIIIRDMLLKGYRTYGEFIKSDEKIATNILADRLQELETLGVITKERDPDNGRKTIYRLTEKGADLAPILLEMIHWSSKYDPNTFAKEKIVNRIKDDRQNFVNEIRRRALDPSFSDE